LRTQIDAVHGSDVIPKATGAGDLATVTAAFSSQAPPAASLSSRVETGNDLYRLPPLATLNVGLRYMFKLLNRPCSARLDVANVTNTTGLTLSSAYIALPQLQRNYTFTFAADL
jgi:hypothetical protein